MDKDSKISKGFNVLTLICITPVGSFIIKMLNNKLNEGVKSINGVVTFPGNNLIQAMKSFDNITFMTLLWIKSNVCAIVVDLK